MARTYHYASNVGTTSTTGNGVETTVVSLTFTPDDNSDYLLMWRMTAEPAGVAVILTATFYDDDGTTVISDQVYNQASVASASALATYGSIKRKSYGASPGSKTYTLKIEDDSGSADLTGQDAWIIALKLATNDQYAEVEANSTASTSTQTDKTTLTFTPGSVGDYLIIWMAECTQTSTGFGRAFAVVDGTNQQLVSEDMNSDTALFIPWMYTERVNLTAASHDIKIQQATNGSGTNHMRRARIAALRLDGFGNNYYAEDQTRTTTASTTYQDKTTLAFTSNAGDHLIVTSYLHDSSSSSFMTETTLDMDGIEDDPAHLDNQAGGGEEYPGCSMRIAVLTAASHTFKLKFRAEAGGGHTAGMQSASISVLQLDEDDTTVSSGDTLCWFTPQMNEAPQSNYATLDLRNGHLVLDFDDTTQEAAMFSAVMPRAYAGNGVTVYLHWGATTAIVGTGGWDVSFEQISDSAQDIDSDGFATAQTVTAATVPTTSGQFKITSVAITDGANMDSVTAGEGFRIRIRRNVSADTAVGDLELMYVEIKET